ncbi:MAG: hypothetical protein ABSE07_04990 [Methanoregula sp.]|jgi:hypothetical protein
MVPEYPDLRFTPITENDLGRLNELVNNLDIVHYVDPIPPVTMDRTRAFFAFAKAVVTGQRIIGCARLRIRLKTPGHGLIFPVPVP